MLHNYYPKPKYLIIGSFGPLKLDPDILGPSPLKAAYVARSRQTPETLKPKNPEARQPKEHETQNDPNSKLLNPLTLNSQC